MNTLTIVVKATGAVAQWEIIGDLPVMGTVKTVPVEGGYSCEITGYELKSGGILHHLRQKGHFSAPDIAF